MQTGGLSAYGALWFVLRLTGSGAAVGLVILCFDLPGVVTGAILGRLLDRYQPRLVMGFDNLARAALIAAIPTLYALGWPMEKLHNYDGSWIAWSLDPNLPIEKGCPDTTPGPWQKK